MSQAEGSNSLSNYFSLEDIMSTQEKLPCKIELPIYCMGYLDPSSESEHLQPGTKLELPYWVARALCSRKRHIVSVELPKQYREGYREILSADATVVDLHRLGPYFYNLGNYLLNFDTPDASDISKTLLKTFQTRFRKIMDSSQNIYNEDSTKFTERLDGMEKLLFRAGQVGLNDFQRWETRQTEKLEISDMVINHRKRKRALIEDGAF